MLIRQVHKRNRAVVSVKIQQHAAGTQHAVPFAVGCGSIGQGPGKVARNHGVKACGFKFQATGVHALKRDLAPGLLRKSSTFVQHGLAHVHTTNAVPQLRQHNGKKSCSRTHIQNAQRATNGQMGQDFGHPQGFFVTGKLVPPYFAVAYSPARPVFFYAASERKARNRQNIRLGLGGICGVLAHKCSLLFIGLTLLSHSRPSETKWPSLPVFAHRDAKHRPDLILRPAPQYDPDA